MGPQKRMDPPGEPVDLGRYLYGRVERVRDECTARSTRFRGTNRDASVAAIKRGVSDAYDDVAAMLDDILRSATSRGGDIGMPNPDAPTPEPMKPGELDRMAEQTLKRPLTPNRVALATAYSNLALSKRLEELTAIVSRSATFAPLPDQGEYEE